MTILSEEARLLLQRMDADDAINKVIELTLEAAARECHNIAFDQGHPALTAYGALLCKTAVLALKGAKQNG